MTEEEIEKMAQRVAELVVERLPDMKIQIIDDDAEFRGYLKKLLLKNDYFVEAVSSGSEALKKIISTIPDLVITDIIMPDMDGFEVIRNIRNSSLDIKIMAISGGGRIKPDVYLNMASKLKADCILQKPFQKDELLDKITTILS
jgi:CheY-like chemotaxis protein